MDDRTKLPETEDILTELGFDPNPRTVGRPRKVVHVEFERDLTEADMAALALPRQSMVKPVQKLRASHHSLARCLAMGMKHTEASLVTGYGMPRISILLQDQSFIELVENYKTEAKGAFADLAERMSDMSLDAISELQDRLADSPETFTTSMLLDLITKFADRTGHGPNQEISLKVAGNFIDRPPQESFEDWERRRAKELAQGGGVEIIAPDIKKLN